MMQTIKGISLNLIIASLFYFGFVEGIEGAQNVVKFFVWAIALPLGLLVLNKSVINDLASKPKQPRIYMALVRLIAWAELIILLWSGSIFTAIAWGSHMLFSAIARLNIEKLRSKSTQAGETDTAGNVVATPPENCS